MCKQFSQFGFDTFYYYLLVHFIILLIKLLEYSSTLTTIDRNYIRFNNRKPYVGKLYLIRIINNKIDTYIGYYIILYYIIQNTCARFTMRIFVF